MAKVLILFAHPKFEQSKANKVLIERVRERKEVTFHDLYEHYPDFNIDIPAEKKLLSEHDVIIWHHPFYWYNCPPLMKQWIDLVLEFGWAYGPGGNALKDKKCLNVITTGGSRDLYCDSGNHNYSIVEFLRPFEQTARLCSMHYLPPFAVMGTHQITADDLQTHARQYDQLITSLHMGKTLKVSSDCEFLNDLLELKKTRQS